MSSQNILVNGRFIHVNGYSARLAKYFSTFAVDVCLLGLVSTEIYELSVYLISNLSFLD